MRSNSVNSMAAIKAWMKEGARTRKWDAILAYDRTKTNQLLMQEYIERFDSASSYLAPITTVIPDTSPFEYFNGVIVSSPVLSFENSSITSSKAKLTFDLIGGTYITLVQVNGTLIKEVTQISELSPQASDKIWLDIDLIFAPGSVTGEGTVQLDLKSTHAKDWGASLGTTDINRQRVAEYLYDLFDQLDPKYQVFILNNIKSNSNSLVTPESFVIRVHPKSGSRLIGLHAEDVDEKDGQVLLFVTMKGGTNGDLPSQDADMAYLIPDDAGYTATILLGTDYIFSKVLPGSIEAFDPWQDAPPKFELVHSENGFIATFSAVGGRAHRRISPQTVGRYQIHFLAVTPTLADSTSDVPDATFKMTPHAPVGGGDMEGGLDIVWRGTGSTWTSIEVDGLKFAGLFTYKWDIEFHAGFVKTGKIIRLRPNPDIPESRIIASLDSIDVSVWDDPFYDSLKQTIRDHYQPILQAIFDDFRLNFTTGVDAINLLNLESLLFRSSEVINYKDQYFSGDLALFGDISPQVTSFSVSPLSPIMVAGNIQTFIATPEVTGLVWTISGLGDDSAIGAIDSSSGKYTAPEAALLVGQLTRVRVTATNPNSGYKSSGLISVVKISVQVNPLIQVATANDTRTLTLTAGSVAGQPKDITWAFEDASTGATLTSHLDGTCTYVPGPAVAGKSYWVDTVVVTSGAQYSSCAVVVVNGMQQLTISLDANSVNSESTFESVTLVVRGDDGNPISGIKWAMLTGSGSVDETTGVFTVDPQGTYRYAVVTAAYSVAGLTLRGVIILPLPLLAIDRAVGLLGDNINTAGHIAGLPSSQ